jgi:hypothetical protein
MTFLVLCRRELAAVIFSGFSARLADPPHQFYPAGSMGLQNFEQGPKKSFSTQSAHCRRRNNGCGFSISGGCLR